MTIRIVILAKKKKKKLVYKPKKTSIYIRLISKATVFNLRETCTSNFVYILFQQKKKKKIMKQKLRMDFDVTTVISHGKFHR